MTEVVRSVANGLLDLCDEYVKARERLSRDRDLSTDARARRISELRAQFLAEAGTKATRLWGRVNRTTGYLEGGLCWEALEEAQKALQEAIDKAEAGDPDPAAVALYTLRMPGVVRRCLVPEDFLAWYERATRTEKRAAQIAAMDLLLEKWGDQAASLVNRLEADLEASRRTPAVEAAEQRLMEVDEALRYAYQVARAAQSVIGVSLWGGDPVNDALEGARRVAPGKWEKQYLGSYTVGEAPTDSGEGGEE